MATTSVRPVTAEQIAAYHRDGYLAVQNVIQRAQLEALRAATDEFVEQARRVASSGPVLDLGRAVLLPLPAGSIHIHHYRAVHGSAENRSSAPRRLLINSYSAADAIPFTPDTQHSPLYGRIVCGAPAAQFRRTAAEWRMPPTWDHGYTSIYELPGRATGAPGEM